MATPRKTPARSAAKPAAAKTGAKPAAAKRSTGTAARKPATAKPAAAKPAATRRATPKAPARTGHSAGIASIGALAVAALGAVAFGAWRLLRRPSEGTEPTDLMGEAHPDGSERALDAFRPDPTAPVPAAEREQFRPALAQVGNTVS